MDSKEVNIDIDSHVFNWIQFIKIGYIILLLLFNFTLFYIERKFIILILVIVIIILIVLFLLYLEMLTELKQKKFLVNYKSF